MFWISKKAESVPAEPMSDVLSQYEDIEDMIPDLAGKVKTLQVPDIQNKLQYTEDLKRVLRNIEQGQYPPRLLEEIKQNFEKQVRKNPKRYEGKPKEELTQQYISRILKDWLPMKLRDIIDSLEAQPGPSTLTTSLKRYLKTE